MTTIKFENVPMNKTFTYDGTRYIKDRPEKGSAGTGTIRKNFTGYMVEYDAPVTTAIIDGATERQYDYIDALNVNLNGKRITKAEASRLIDSVKNGDGCGSFGFSFYGGSN